MQLLELVQVDVAELVVQTLGQHHEDHDAQQHVEGDAELDQEGHARGDRNATRAMPLSMSNSPTI